MATGLDQLDDGDYPAFTMGQAAQLLGVQAAFLRSLDVAGVVAPQRSDGGGTAAIRVGSWRSRAGCGSCSMRARRLDAAARIVGLQDRLEIARARIVELESDLGAQAKPADDRR